MYKFLAGFAGAVAMVALAAPSHATTRPAVDVAQRVHTAAFAADPAAPQATTVQYYYDRYHHRHWRDRHWRDYHHHRHGVRIGPVVIH